MCATSGLFTVNILKIVRKHNEEYLKKSFSQVWPPTTWEAEAGGWPQIQGQFSIYHEFQSNQGYTVKLKKTTKKTLFCFFKFCLWC